MSLNLRGNYLCGSVTVVEYFEHITRASIEDHKKFLHFIFLIFGSCVLEMHQIVFDVGKP